MIGETQVRRPWPATTFLGRLTAGERQALFRLGRRKEYGNGTYVLRQGATGRDVFVVLGGRVEILMLERGGREERIAVRAPGDIVGEMAYMDARPRSASAVAIGPVSALHLAFTALNHFLEVHPNAYRPLALTLTDRLRASDVRQLELKSDVESRVAAALCQLAMTESSDADLPLIVRRTQRELGEMIGAATVSIHRALRKLAGRHCIRTSHRAVVILDLDILAAVAGTRMTKHRLT